MAEQLPRTPDQFDRELDFGWITKFMIVLALVTIASFVAMWYMGVFLDHRLADAEPEGSPLLERGVTTIPPLPHLQVESYTAWPAMKSEQDHVLSVYTWEDQSTGRVRIPVEQAMQDIAAHGLPRFKAVGDGTLTTGGQP